MISEYGEIILKTPYKSQKKVFELLQSKEGWLRKSLQKADLRRKPKIPEEIELFGEIIPTVQTDLHALIERLKEPSMKNIERSYDTFYKELAKEYLPKRVRHFETKMNLQCKEIRYRKMKRRWGSCSSEGIITFNTNLMKREKRFIDEVVVHELAHLVHFNHSKDFHQLVARFI